MDMEGVILGMRDAADALGLRDAGMTPENALPPGIRRSLAGWEAVPDTVGRSRAAVCRYTRGVRRSF